MQMQNVDKLRPVTFSSVGSHPVRLEGRYHYLDAEGEWPAAVVCHPHPLGGGTMHNSVVVAISRALAARGVMALRFNFRGVGASEGEYGGGQGEQDDVAGALAWLLAQPMVDPRRISVVGYSFGAWVGLAYAQSDPRVAAVAAVGLIPEYVDADALRSFTRPKLFITGEHDPLAPAHSLRKLVDELPPPKELHVVAGADHFWRGLEPEVGEMVAHFIRGV